MSRVYGRRAGARVSADVAKARILAALARGALSKAALGRSTWPEARFASPQGAPFAVARLVRELTDAGLVRLDCEGWRLELTAAGRIERDRIGGSST